MRHKTRRDLAGGVENCRRHPQLEPTSKKSKVPLAALRSVSKCPQTACMLRFLATSRLARHPAFFEMVIVSS